MCSNSTASAHVIFKQCMVYVVSMYLCNIHIGEESHLKLVHICTFVHLQVYVFQKLNVFQFDVKLKSHACTDKQCIHSIAISELFFTFLKIIILAQCVFSC